MDDNVDDVIGCEPVALTEYHTTELWKCIHGIPQILNPTEITTKCERLEHILSIYSNKYLLFPIVPEVTFRLMNMIRLSSPPLDSQSECSFIFLYTFSKFVGFKQTSKYLPMEINLLKNVLECAEYYSKSSTSKRSPIQFNNEIFSGIQIWLYILVKNPFNLRNIARGTADVDGLDSISYRIKTLIENESKDLTKLGCNVYAQLYTRNASNSKALSHYMDGLIDVKMNSKMAIYNLQILNSIFKLGKREELVEFTDLVLNYCNLCYASFEKNAIVVVHCIKLFQRACMIYLSPKLANWRYQRQNKRIECSFDIQHVEFFERSLEGVDRIEQENRQMIEGVLQSLKMCLDSDSNGVRWASAKGMARILARLPENHTQRVVDEMMTRLRKDKSTCFWNGACLLLAELTTRGCILPKTIPLLLGIVREAMLFDFGGFMNTTETNVRDSACYICWSIARAYPKEIFQPSLELLSNLLICTALFDRDVNVRRAASASFQEHVGRHGGFSHGIQVLVAIDFAAVAMIKRCFSDVCVNVARFHEYLKPMLDFLCHHKTINWDDKVRELTGYALQRLAPLDIQYSKETLFPYLMKELTATHDIIHKHGLLFACSSIISVVSDELNTDDESVLKVVSFVSDSLDTMRSRKLEHVPLLIRGICKVMKSLLDTSLVTGKVTVMKWVLTVECILENVRVAEVKGLQIATKDLLVGVLQSVFDFWSHRGDEETIRNHLDLYIVQLKSTDNEDRLVANAMAIENLPEAVIVCYTEEILTIQNILSEQILHPRENIWVFARIAALRALVSLYVIRGGRDDFKVLLNSLISCYKDQTASKNGDIGRFVRQAALENTVTVLDHAMRGRVLERENINVVLAHVYGLLFDSVDNNIRVAQETVRSLLQTDILIDDKERMVIVFQKETLDPQEFADVIYDYCNKQHVLRRAVIALGSLVISVANSAWEFLFVYLNRDNRKMDHKFMDGFVEALSDFFESSESLDDQIRYCRAFGVLVERRIFEIYESDPSISPLFTRVCDEFLKIGKGKCSTKLKHVVLKTVGSLMLLNYTSDVNSKARKMLCSCLVCPYSALRSLSSELLQHYLSMADEKIYEAENVQKALFMLNDLNWTRPKEEIEQDGRLIGTLLSSVN